MVLFPMGCKFFTIAQEETILPACDRIIFGWGPISTIWRTVPRRADMNLQLRTMFDECVEAISIPAPK